VARIVSIDYGTKRCGIATTDPLQLIVSGLETVPTSGLFDFLDQYLSAEPVEKLVVGEPLHLDGQPAQIHHLVVGFVRKAQKRYAKVEVVTWDERFSSEEAKEVILKSGARQKKRRDKGLVDKVSAALILQDYMEQNVW